MRAFVPGSRIYPRLDRRPSWFSPRIRARTSSAVGGYGGGNAHHVENGLRMTVTATLELAIAPESADVALRVIHEVLEATRAFPGNRGVDVLVDSTNPLRIVLLERWESLEADAAYRAWRAGDGASDLGSILAGPPVLALFTTVEGV